MALVGTLKGLTAMSQQLTPGTDNIFTGDFL